MSSSSIGHYPFKGRDAGITPADKLFCMSVMVARPTESGCQSGSIPEFLGGLDMKSWFESNIQIIWGMGLLGVVTSLAPRITGRFDADILHHV